MKRLIFLSLLFFLAKTSLLFANEMDVSGLESFNVRLEMTFLRKGGEKAFLEMRWTDPNALQETIVSLGRSHVTWTHPEQETALPSRSLLERSFSYGEEKRILFKKRGNEIQLFVDGDPLGRTPLPQEVHKIIWRASSQGIAFSEPTLQPVAEVFLQDDFMRTEKELGEWEILSGDWSVSSLSLPEFSSNPFCFKGTKEGTVRAGHWFWENYRISAAVRFADDQSQGGLLVCGGEKEEGLLFLYRPGTMQLIERKGDKDRLLDSKEITLRPEQWYEFSLCSLGSNARGAIDGCSLCSTEDARLFQGPAGLFVKGGEDVYFDDVEVTSVQELAPPRMGRHPPLIGDSFATDRFMANWAKLSVKDKEGLLDYTFHRAPVDWVIQTGHWGIQNRWTCQPRWTWFGGQGEGTATIWHKASFKGDVVLDLFAAFKMDRPFDPPYRHPGDINVTICGDGQNLASGYTFVYAGWNNTWSRLLRESRVVAETQEHLLPDLRNDFAYQGLHIPWYHIRMAKQGNTIQCSVGDQIVLSYQDPDPLPGNRLALWTWKNGLLLARTRIEAEALKPPQRSDLDETIVPATPATSRAWKTPPLVPGRPWRLDLPVDKVDLREAGRLQLQVRMSLSFKGNLYLKARDWLHCVSLTAPEVKADEIPVIGEVDWSERGELWTEVEVDLSEALLDRYGQEKPIWLQEAFLGLESDVPYILCGFAGNTPRDFCEIQKLRFKKSQHRVDRDTGKPPRIVAVGVKESESLWQGFEGEKLWPGSWLPFHDDQGPLLTRDPWQKAEGLYSLRLKNPVLGGAFGIWIRSQPLNPEKIPEFSFFYRTNPSLRLDLRVLLGEETRTIRFTDVDNTWPCLGSIESVVQDSRWHLATVPLLALLKNAGLQDRQVTGLQLASQGYPGNQEGQVLRVDDLSLLRNLRANAPFRVWWRSEGTAAGYSFHTDVAPEAVPDEVVDVEIPEAILEGHPPGRFWFHVRGVDEEGRWGPACHLELMASPMDDESSPEAEILHPVPGTHGTGEKVVVHLKDEGAGIDPSSIRLTVQDALFHIGNDGLTYDASTGELRWERTKMKSAPSAFQDGARVKCRLKLEDRAGNALDPPLEWTWRVNHALDEVPPPTPVLSERPAHPLFLFDFEEGSPSWGNWGGCELRRTNRFAATGDASLSLANLETLETFYMALVDTGPIPISEHPLLSVQILPPADYPGSGVTFELVKLFFDGKLDTVKTLAQLPKDAAPGRWHTLSVDLSNGIAEGHQDPYGFLLGARRVAKGNEGITFHVDNFIIASSTNASPGFVWSEPADASGIAGYSWVLDQKEDTVPPEEIMGTKTETSFSLVAPGTWWFHLRAVDNAGNWGESAHRSVLVASSPQE